MVLALVAAAVVLSRRDPSTLVSATLVLLFVIPGNQAVVGPLRSVGKPAILLGLACFAAWAAGRLMGWLSAQPLHPLRWTVWLYVTGATSSYAAAMSRYLTPDEMDSATRTIFPVLATVGVAMLAMDGLDGWGAVERVLKVLVFVAGLQGLIGVLEFFLGIDYTTMFDVPGLKPNTENVDLMRSGFLRITAAAVNPIEFSVALGAVLPLALHFALNHRGPGRARWWVLLGLVLVAVPLTVSRSGLLALAVGMVVYGAVLSRRMQLNILVLAVIGAGAFRAAVPGVLGTIKYFFFAGSTDNSITGRTDDYAHIGGLMHDHWWFGRGFGTFLPLSYFYLDNQYLMSMLNGGLLGLVILIALYVVAMSTARGARKRTEERVQRDLAQAVAASIAAFALTALTFDQFSFDQCGFTLFVLIGCAGALWTASRRRVTTAPAESGRAISLAVR